MDDDEIHRKLTELSYRAEELFNLESFDEKHLEELDRIYAEEDILMSSPENKDGITMQHHIKDLELLNTSGKYLGKAVQNIKTSDTGYEPLQLANFMNAACHGVQDSIFVEFPMLTRYANSDLCDTLKSLSLDQLLVSAYASSGKKEKPSKILETPSLTSASGNVTETKKPEQLENVSNDGSATDVRVQHILKHLIRHYKQMNNQPVDYYKFILHPTSFSIVAENMFHISLLIKDGLVYLGNEDEQLTIEPSSKAMGAMAEERKLRRCAVITQMSPKTWKEQIEQYPIKESMIPDQFE